MENWNNKKLRLLVCGTGWSGSGAIIDWLREFDGVGVVPGEFDDFRRSDMIGDIALGIKRDGLLGTTLVDRSPRLKRFRRAKSIIRFSKKLLTRVMGKHNKKVLSILEVFKAKKAFRIERKLLIAFYRNWQEAESQEKTIEITTRWIEDVSRNYGKSITVFDQPLEFDEGRHAILAFQVFAPAKFIFVIRDIDDQIANIMRDAPWYPAYLAKQFNYSGTDEKDFLSSIIRCRVRNMQNSVEKLGREVAMLVKFEEFVLQHEMTAGFLRDVFIGPLLGRQTRRLCYFDSLKSKQNIGNSLYRSAQPKTLI